MPKVSVIIPIYNSARFLEETIRSVFAQTYTDWEIVAVDDGSEENITEVIEKFAHTGRIKFISQSNKGPAFARNVGIEQSGGEYLAFLDGDDIWKNDKLQLQVEYLDSDKDYALCYSAFELIDQDSKYTGPGYVGTASTYTEMLSEFGVLPSSATVRRDAALHCGLFDTSLQGAHDVDLFLKLARHYRVKYIDKVLTSYRIHGKNMSRNDCDRWLVELRHVFLKHGFHASRAEQEAIKKGMDWFRRPTADFLLDEAREALKLKKIPKVLNLIVRSVKAGGPDALLTRIAALVKEKITVLPVVHSDIH